MSDNRPLATALLQNIERWIDTVEDDNEEFALLQLQLAIQHPYSTEAEQMIRGEKLASVILESLQLEQEL